GDRALRPVRPSPGGTRRGLGTGDAPSADRGPVPRRRVRRPGPAPGRADRAIVGRQARERAHWEPLEAWDALRRPSTGAIERSLGAVQRDDDTTDPTVSLERRMLDAERRAREIAENAQAEAEAAREEAVRAREEAERAHRLETHARERLQVLVEAGVAMAASREMRSVLAAATGAGARPVCDHCVA